MLREVVASPEALERSTMRERYQRRLLGTLFILAGLNHFIVPRAYQAIMPDYLPAHAELVAASGIAEVALGLLAFVPRARWLTRWGLIALLLALFPANLHMALHAERYVPIPPALLWLRLPLQGVLIAWIWRVTAPANDR
jgi:uncharacterized membrane protein